MGIEAYILPKGVPFEQTPGAIFEFTPSNRNILAQAIKENKGELHQFKPGEHDITPPGFAEQGVPLVVNLLVFENGTGTVRSIPTHGDVHVMGGDDDDNLTVEKKGGSMCRLPQDGEILPLVAGNIDEGKMLLYGVVYHKPE